MRKLLRISPHQVLVEGAPPQARRSSKGFSCLAPRAKRSPTETGATPGRVGARADAPAW